MQRLAPLVWLALVLLASYCRGQGEDLSLSDALPDTEPTKKPATGPKKTTPDNGFNLEDAVGGEDEPSPPQHPGGHGNKGEGFDDSDLLGDSTLPPEKPGGGQGSDSNTGENTEGGGMLAGIISSVAVAVVGAVSSFIAYQKKKLCFKASDQENVNMESQQGAHAEPPVQRTLLQKS
ncbi:CD99 antigen-like isoform X2 [Eublepharis macularius]|uniref:CD99 antigen-like isoform X2 n=1 Tax=Eublepharis macularius TaxID=481883 RepID=A0AA97KSF0_EUBMA|nr:CD99 antigen-like isoform X2 [Eublepharis macularius]